LGAKANAWAVQSWLQEAPRLLAAPEPVDLRNWAHNQVGWGLVLPENETVPEQQRALALDAPDPLAELVFSRNQAPVFRYRADLHYRFLRRYYVNQPPRDIAISGSPRGTGPTCLPRYLLIYGTPREIPWSLQYVLNSAAFVGRLDLVGDSLARYVAALRNNWAGAGCRADRPVVWSVDHGHPDITWLMRRVIASPVADKLTGDSQIGSELRLLAGIDATVNKLGQTLAERQPALIVTTSHGMTGPLADPPLMARQLGWLVDKDFTLLDPAKLLESWQPAGAIWYAHACCSAGSDDQTSYLGLVETGSAVEQTLTAVAGLGAQVAPLPRLLLGAERPLRAFIGQVEPTFDWTLRQPETGQVLTASLQAALYQRMYRQQPEPVGLAFEACYRHVGELLAQWNQALRQIANGRPDASLAALRTQLTALDRQSMVILGDPTACLPSL
jgi:hypothetical protein